MRTRTRSIRWRGRLSGSYRRCPHCGELLIFRPWFTDRNGVKHFAVAYGLTVFRWCPNRCKLERERLPVRRKA